MATKGFIDFENLKQYDEQLKNYIDKKIAEAINTYREKDKADDNLSDNQSENVTE